MRISGKTIVVFPEDPSIGFLEPVIEQIKATFRGCEFFFPQQGLFLEVDDMVEVIIFLGHGSSFALYGPDDQNGEKITFLDVDNASRMFAGLSIILLSCKSADFIKNVRRNVALPSFLGFGDMPTDWPHIMYLRESDPHYLQGLEETHLDFYKTILVNGFINGLKLLQVHNNSRSLFLGIQQTINVAINNVIFETAWTTSLKLHMVDLLNDLKNEIRYL